MLWESADILTSVVVGAREAADLDRSRHHQGQRGVFLRGLLYGSAGPLSIREHAAAFGLAGDRSYYAVRARAANATQRDELQTRLEASIRTYGCRPLLDLVDGDVAGIVPLKPTLSDPRFTIGIGGAHELGDLAIHVAVAAEPELGALLVECYLLPLHHEGDYGAELEDTIRVHLEAGARINETARRLQLHPNSVRHRLTRFEELTGARLDGLTVQFEIWWALAWLRHERRSARGAE